MLSSASRAAVLLLARETATAQVAQHFSRRRMLLLGLGYRGGRLRLKGITAYFVVFGRYPNSFQQISASNHWPKLPPSSEGLRDLLSQMLSHRAGRLDIDNVLAHHWIAAGDGSTTTSTPRQQIEWQQEIQRQKFVDRQAQVPAPPPVAPQSNMHAAMQPGQQSVFADSDICKRFQNLGLSAQQQMEWRQQLQRQQLVEMQLVDRYQPPRGGFGLDADEVYASMLERERKQREAGEYRCDNCATRTRRIQSHRHCMSHQHGSQM